MSRHDSPISRVTGRRQALALRIVVGTVLALATIGTVSESRLSAISSIGAVWLIVGTPWLRLSWLAYRWAQERDWSFVVAALALFVVLAVGVLAAH